MESMFSQFLVQKILEKKKDANYLRKELKRSAFTRSFTLGEMLNPDEISAEFKNGILELAIPKKEKVIPPVKKITIK